MDAPFALMWAALRQPRAEGRVLGFQRLESRLPVCTGLLVFRRFFCPLVVIFKIAALEMAMLCQMIQRAHGFMGAQGIGQAASPQLPGIRRHDNRPFR
jgi:hypothetical protein